MPSRRQPCATAWVRPSVAPSLTSPRTVLWCRSATPRSWPRRRAALAAVERAGIQVVLVTARPPRWLHDLADLVGEHGLALCGNGAFVYDVRSRLVLDEHCMAAGDVARIAADLRNALPGTQRSLRSATCQTTCPCSRGQV